MRLGAGDELARDSEIRQVTERRALVESGGPGRKFEHLTRGDLRCESGAEVSRGHSSEESR
jgi:hypothetical protein